MKRKLFASGQAAKMLGIPRWQLLYHLERGHAPEPQVHVPGRRLFTALEIEAIRTSLMQKTKEEQPKPPKS